MRFLPLTAALLLLAPVSARALNWSLGANLGLAVVMPDVGDDVTIFAWPLDPGIRVGFMGDDPSHEFYVNTSLLLLSNGGTSAAPRSQATTSTTSPAAAPCRRT